MQFPGRQFRADPYPFFLLRAVQTAGYLMQLTQPRSLGIREQQIHRLHIEFTNPPDFFLEFLEAFTG